MTIRKGLLAVGAVVAVLSTALTAQAFAQPLLTGSGTAAVSTAATDAVDATDTAAAAQAAAEAQATADEAARTAALNQLDATLNGMLGNAASDYSIAAYDPSTGLSYDYGAASGMYTASIVKVEILAAVLLQHQDAGTDLTATELSLATAMIEQSDNDAATTLWTAIGGESGLNTASSRLGLVSTFGGSNGYWGLTTTSAADQVTLLGRLTSATSPLSAASQATLLSLMASVTADQAWGASAAADVGTTTALKNGWLSLSADDGLWVVNTIGLPTVDGSTIQVAVLLRGVEDFDTGVALAQRLASAVTEAIAALRSLGPVDQSALSAT